MRRLLLSSLFICFTLSQAMADQLHIYAGAGLRPPIEKVVEKFEKETGNTVTVEYGGSGQILTRIPRDKQHIIALLNKMNIAHLAKRYPHEISGGEQQRIALARAMISSPSLLLLDEPFSSLDWQTREQIWSQVNQLKRNGITILLVTHEQKEAAALAEYHVAIENGNILQS
ncbi:TPA: ATP-binding cassette domain-containing protein [Providencia rettgeri]|nr:ATP-binding cassette domain-containing protein [Providencia rettgeri]